MARASLLLEIAELTVPENFESQKAFDTTLLGLYHLSQEPDSDRWAIVFAYRLLAEQGLRPSFSECVSCFNQVNETKTVF